jgi:hypothetical protein
MARRGTTLPLMQYFLSGSEKNHENLLQDSRFWDVEFTLTKQPTNPTEKNPSSEAEKSSASQEIPRISWKPKVHHHTYKRPQPIPILSQINHVHTAPSTFTACVVPKEKSKSEAMRNVSFCRKLQRWRIFDTSPKSQARRPPLVSSPKQLIQHIRC